MEDNGEQDDEDNNVTAVSVIDNHDQISHFDNKDLSSASQRHYRTKDSANERKQRRRSTSKESHGKVPKARKRSSSRENMSKSVNTTFTGLSKKSVERKIK